MSFALTQVVAGPNCNRVSTDAEGGSFNLEAVKEQIEKAMQSHAGK
jgi:hypothetical protein